MGPVIGLVTETTANILFEFNRDIKKLNLLLQPIKPLGPGLAAGPGPGSGSGVISGSGLAPAGAGAGAEKSITKKASKSKHPKEVTLSLANVEAYKAVVG